MTGSGRKALGTRVCPQTIVWASFRDILDPFLAMMVFRKGASSFNLSGAISRLWSSFGTEVGNTCRDIGWHCSVSRLHCPYAPSETSPAQSVAVLFDEGLPWSARTFKPVLDSVLGFSGKYSF